MLVKFIDYDSADSVDGFIQGVNIEDFDKYINAIKIIGNVTLFDTLYKVDEIHFSVAPTEEHIHVIEVIVHSIEE